MVKTRKRVTPPYSNKFVRELKIFNQEIDECPELSAKSFRKFRRMSAELSSRLPNLSDKTICEIDDILYPVEDVKIPSLSGKRTKEMFKDSGLLATSCFQLYHNVYSQLCTMGMRPHIHILDNTYLQLLENTAEESLKSDAEFVKSFAFFLFINISTRDKLCLGIGLKFVNVALDKDRSVISGMSSKETEFDKIAEFLWLSKLQKIPEAKNPQQRRLTEWLARQSTAMFSKFDIKSIQFDSDLEAYYNVYNSLNEENLDANYINLLLRTTEHERYFMLHQLDHLYSFFKSAKDEKTKLKRLEDFLKGVRMSVEKDDGPEDLSELFVSKISSIVKSFNLRINFLYLNHVENEESAWVIERYQKYKIKPYLSEGSNGDPSDQSAVPLNEKDEDSDNSIEEVDYKIMPDYTIEKFFYYDEFMRSLELMSIIRTAFAMHEIIFKRKVANEAVIFRQKGVYTDVIQRCLLAGFVCRCIWGWYLEAIIREGLFLILSDDLHYMKRDLTNFLKGYYVDVSKKESLYFAVNSFVVTGGPYDHTLEDF